MRYKGRRQSTNVDDRRRSIPGGRKGGLGCGGIIIVLIIAYATGVNPMLLFQGAEMVTSNAPATSSQSYEPSAEEEELAAFVRVVLADTEDVWNEVFQEEFNADYPEPTLVLFTQTVRSACGMASAASGPFYCPADQRVYIDLSFYDELKNRFGAPGDFAMAYVVAHEVGHHVQKLLGLTEKVHSLRGRVSQREYNQASVRLELQADFYAGFWANRALGHVQHPRPRRH